MVHHIILWKIKEEKTEQEKLDIKKGVKRGLRDLRELFQDYFHAMSILMG